MAEIVRWGIAATGGIARQFVDGLGLLPDAEVVAVASRRQERADEFGAAHDIPHRYGSYEALAADPDVDVVYVATPQHRHCADTILYLEAGKPVLCEKPLALDRHQVDRMLAAAEASGCFLMEAIWSRFLPSYVHLRELLDDGAIGEVRLVEADFGFELPFDPDHRLYDLARGGGATLDLGVYPVQLASLVLGPPDSVGAAGHVGETGVDEHTAAVLHHPSGALGVVKAAIRTNMTCTARIAGTRGVIELPAFMHAAQGLTVRTRKGSEEIDASYEGEGLRFQATEVHRCLREGLRESPVMPWVESRSIAATLDEILTQVGVSYPAVDVGHGGA